MKTSFTAYKVTLKASLFILIFFEEVMIIVNKSDHHNDTLSEDILYNENLFEGDLMLPKELILRFYNFSSLSVGEKLLKKYIDSINRGNDTEDQNVHRAALRDTNNKGSQLWLNNIVWYIMHYTLTPNMTRLIKRAMNHFENKTCLRFLPASAFNPDHIYFTDTDKGCYSNSIGRRRGTQIINLQAPECQHLGIALHEIGHAIGFWHEQSRPDRDQYIRVNLQNIPDGKRGNFLKINEFEVDNQGSKYDYSSVMHYTLGAFAKDGCVGNDCLTMSVINESEYIRQGSPTIGQFHELSVKDIVQVNRMYSCPCGSGAGLEGNLTIFIRTGTNIPSVVYTSKIPDSSVVITAVDCFGNQVIKNTRHVLQDRNPSYNEWLLMGVRRWQFFRISAWDIDGSYLVSPLMMSQTIVVSFSPKHFQKYCQNYACKSYILFDHEVNRTYMKENLPTASVDEMKLIVSPTNSSRPKVKIQITLCLISTIILTALCFI